MIEIPKQLQKNEFRFIRIRKGTKIPADERWQIDNNYIWTEFPEKSGFAYGIATGFGNLFVIDFDDLETQERVMPFLPDTFTVKTGGRGLYHLYYISPIPPKSFKLVDDGNTLVDVQGIGKQVIGPNSIHSETGNKYEIVKNIEISEFNIEELRKVFPKTEIKEFGKNNDNPGGNCKRLEKCRFHNDNSPSLAIYDNDTFYCFGCHAHGNIDVLNADFKTIGTKKTKNGTYYYIKREEKEFIPKKEDIDIKDIWTTDTKGNTKLSYINTATLLRKTFDFITIGGKTKEIYFYENGIYKKGGEGLISRVVHLWTKGFIKLYDIKEIIGHIHRTTWKEEIPEEKSDMICVNNGIIDINTLKLMPHSPDYIFLQKIPHNYIDWKDCPNIKKFLSEILQEEDIPLVQEMIGYILLRKGIFKKAFIIYGMGDSGKTTFLKMLIRFVGENNTSGVSLHKILYDRFACNTMFKKLLNFYDDLSYRDISDTGAFKIATGDGYVSAEEKFGESFTFKNYAKLIFACNRIPDVKNTDDEAYFNRWILIPFKNSFRDKADRDLIKKITTDDEMSGLLNFALEGLKRLLDNKGFSNEIDSNELKDIMLRNSNPIARFIQDCVCEHKEGWISKEDLYTIYCEYMTYFKVNDGIVTKQKFGKELLKIAPFLIDSQRNIIIDGKEKKGVHGWSNFKLNDEDSIGNEGITTKENTELTGFFQLLYIYNNNNTFYNSLNRNILVNSVLNIHKPILENFEHTTSCIENKNTQYIDFDENDVKKEQEFEILMHIKTLISNGKDINVSDLVNKYGSNWEKYITSVLNDLKNKAMIYESKPSIYAVLN